MEIKSFDEKKEIFLIEENRKLVKYSLYNTISTGPNYVFCIIRKFKFSKPSPNPFDSIFETIRFSLYLEKNIEFDFRDTKNSKYVAIVKENNKNEFLFGEQLIDFFDGVKVARKLTK